MESRAFPLEQGRTFLLRLPRGAELTEAILTFCRKEGIRFGALTGLGAVTEATLGFYDQAAGEYRRLRLEGPREILALVGNLSLKDGEVFLHAHITLGEEDGRAVGGHLFAPTRVFACEIVLQELLGQGPERRPDPETGLALW